MSRFRLLKTGWNDSSNFGDIIGVTVDKNIKLHAVRLFGSDNNEYSVSLNVYSRKNLPSERVASEKGNFYLNLFKVRWEIIKALIFLLRLLLL